jgi:hypothetical protein
MSSGERPKGPMLIALAAVMLLTALVYFPILFGKVLYQRDISRYTFPARAFLHEAWRNGWSMLWNPLQGLGQSTLSNPLYGLFYPLGAPLLLAFSPWLLSLFLLAHLILGGLGMVVLVRVLARVPFAAAVIAGLAWCLSGYATSEATAGLLLLPSAYFPWCALGLVRFCRVVQGRMVSCGWVSAAAWAAVPFALCFLTGEVFFPFLAALFALAVAVGDALSQAREGVAMVPARVWAPRMAAGFVLAGALTALLAAVVLLPAGTAADATARMKPLSLDVSEVGSLHPLRLTEMVAPGAMGDPYTNYPGGPWVGERAFGDRPLLYGCYLGSSVLALALLAFGRGRRLATVLGLAALGALVVSFGRHTWGHAIVGILVPPLAFMRGPEKYLSIFFACTSLLAGLGSARLLEHRQGWRRMLWVVLALLLLVVGSRFYPAPLIGQVRASALVGLAFAVAIAALAWLVGRARGSLRFAGPLAVAVVLVDLASAVFPLQNFAPASDLGGTPPAAVAILADARSKGELAPPRVHRVRSVDSAIAAAAPPRTVLQVQQNLVRTLVENHPGAFGIGSVPGYDAALPTSLALAWKEGQSQGVSLFRLLGVDYLVLPQAERELFGLSAMMDPVPGTRLYRVNQTLPRVYLAQPTSVAPDAVAVTVMYAPEVLAGKRAVPAVDPQPPDEVKATPPTVEDLGRCQLRSFQNARVEATCDAKTFALAVFVEQYDPGWSATVDGKPAALVRANLAMRAVPLSPGQHTVVLSFWPRGLTAGLLLSALGLMVLVGMLSLCRSNRRPSS